LPNGNIAVPRSRNREVENFRELIELVGQIAPEMDILRSRRGHTAPFWRGHRAGGTIGRLHFMDVVA
jgi:hypothetical protein